jgi:hypothetical protein
VTVVTDWGHEGREVGVTLDACHAVVVVGTDADATVDAALGIARVQAQHRRVTVVDMLGDAPGLQALVPADDPHGLVDSFVYGVSFSRVAYQVPDAGELFVIPSGTEPLDHAELFLHPRWKSLIASVAGVGALLVVVAPADAPEVVSLVELTDGAVLVGDAVPPDLPVAAALTWIRPRRTAPMQVAIALPPAQSVPTGVETADPPPLRGRHLGKVAGVAALLVLSALGIWLAARPFASEIPVRQRIPLAARTPRPAPAALPPADGAGAATAERARQDSLALDAARRDSSQRDSIARILGISPDSVPRLAVANPLDSAAASAWSVFLEETLTKSGAILNLAQKFKTVPVGTFGVNPRTRFFSVYSGAFPTRAGADSLLESLRTRRLIGGDAGTVIAVPYAFLVQSDVPADGAAARVARYRAGGHPVYALRQPDGTAQLYFGAYATPQQAALALPAVREAKLTPTLVFRTGRIF